MWLSAQPGGALLQPPAVHHRSRLTAHKVQSTHSAHVAFASISTSSNNNNSSSSSSCRLPPPVLRLSLAHTSQTPHLTPTGGSDDPPNTPPRTRPTAPDPGDDPQPHQPTTTFSPLLLLAAALSAALQQAAQAAATAALALAALTAAPSAALQQAARATATAALALVVLAAAPPAAHAAGPSKRGGPTYAPQANPNATPFSLKDMLAVVEDENAFDEGSTQAIPRGGSISALKRLLREVFADVITLKQQVEDLTPRSEDDDYVIPYDGGSVRPVMRPVAPGVHLKSKAQLSGTLSWWTPLMASRADAPRTWAVAGSGTPHATVLVQSMWLDKRHSLTARLTNTDESSAAATLGMGAALLPPNTLSPPRATAPPVSIAPSSPSLLGSSSSGLVLQSLLYRAELLQGRLKLCLAPLGGSLASMARRLNPVAAASSLTHVGGMGHGVSMALEQGAGAVATWVAMPRRGAGESASSAPEPQEGALSVSLGHFLMPPGPAHATPVRQTLGQLSLHTRHNGCISLVLASCPGQGRDTDAPAPSAAQQAGALFVADGPPLGGAADAGWGRRSHDVSGLAALLMQGGAATPTVDGQQPSGTPGRLAGLLQGGGAGREAVKGRSLVRMGLCACTTLDACSLAAWHARTLRGGGGGGLRAGQDGSVPAGGSSVQQVLRVVPDVGGSSTGVQLCSVPDSRGVQLSLTWAAVGQGTPSGGAAAMSLASQVDSSLQAEQGAESGKGGVGSRWQGLSHLTELSAYVPLRDGVSITPGIVLLHGSGVRGLTMACGTNWRF